MLETEVQVDEAEALTIQEEVDEKQLPQIMVEENQEMQELQLAETTNRFLVLMIVLLPATAR